MRLITGRAMGAAMAAGERKLQVGAAGGRLDAPGLADEIMRLNGCASVEQVKAMLAEISSRLGFEAFLYAGRFHAGGTRYKDEIVTNYSDRWLQRYEQQGYIHVDPTFLHARDSLSPLVWTEAMCSTSAQRRFKRDAWQHGFGAGVTFPVQSRNGDFARLNLSMSRHPPEALARVRGVLMCGALLASVTHDAMERVVRQRALEQAPKLTKRETEVLHWIAKGKSNWDISKLVGISEHGVSHHVRNILLKFSVASRHQAVATAHALGMLKQNVHVLPRPGRQAGPAP